MIMLLFFFSSRRRHTRLTCDWSSDVCSSDLAHAIAVIANDGVSYTPHLVKSVQSLKTGEVREIARDPASSLGVKPEYLAVIKNALVGVNREGTSAAAFKNSKYVSGGKTGTAQVFSLKGEKY